MADYDIDGILEDINTRLAGEYVTAFRDYLVAVVLRNKPQMRDTRLKLEEVVAESMGRAEVLGALGTLRLASRTLADEGNMGAYRAGMLAFSETAAEKILHRVTFAKALEDLVDRTPVVLRAAAERAAGRIARLYQASGIESRGVIAFAKSAEASVTQRAQELISKGIREGIPEREIGRSIKFGVDRIRKETDAWTESYARMAFRTNLNDAVTKGRIRQARDPDVAVATPALRYTASKDSDTRPNHRAADGIILTADNPRWNEIRSPLGYNCRCKLILMSRPQLRRMGRIDKYGNVVETRIPTGAKPDEGFRPGGM